MKRIGKWLLGLITSALTLVLVIVLLPYAAKWVARIMPDESAAAIRASVVLSQKLEQSAKLETLHVTEEGALNYEVNADRKSTRLNSSHYQQSRMPSSA